MSNLKKILTVQEENEIEDVYYRIYYWYAEELDSHRQALPTEEFSIAKAALDLFLKEARVCRNLKDLHGIKEQYKKIIWFMLPWRVTMWYSFMKKDKKNKETINPTHPSKTLGLRTKRKK